MRKTTLLVATALLFALGGAAYAQPAATNDPAVQLRAEEQAIKKTYSEKKKALDAPRNSKAKAAGDKAAKDATAKGQDAAVARRDAEAKVKSSTKAEYDSKLSALKKERDDALGEVRKKYGAAGGTPAPQK